MFTTKKRKNYMTFIYSAIIVVLCLLIVAIAWPAAPADPTEPSNPSDTVNASKQTEPTEPKESSEPVNPPETSSEQINEKDNIATGDILTTSAGEQYTLIVTGDINKDGKLNLKDFVRMRLYLLDENELSLFSEAKEETKEKSRGLKGSLIGAGIGAGISATALGSILGLGEIADKKKLQLDNEYVNLEHNKLFYEKRGDLKAVKKIDEALNRFPPKVDKYLDGPWQKIKSLRDCLKQNPGKAAAIAAGIAALGAGTGYGVSKLKNRKRKEE